MRERKCLRKIRESRNESGHEMEERGEDMDEMGWLEGERKRK